MSDTKVEPESGKESRRKRGQGCQQRRMFVASREKQVWKHQGRSRGEDVKVEELDGRTDKTGRSDTGRGVDRLLGRGFAVSRADGHAHIPDSYELVVAIRLGGWICRSNCYGR